ncbi:tyrosine protein phosphatase non receptor type [Echinococcus multilocularis]|uniref:Tyrosine protein phosphatase non receptor type n=1 Tax=Echinococcus multilocularis TaxID=6211 RepID=A0A068YAF6_ECHMU|nr:tyrosine protein phosphatase non receptor type [Echinococcus multilocularis]
MTLRLKGSYSVSAAENPTYRLPFKPITCNVIFLDDKSELFKLDKNVRGQVLIDLVFDFLELLERDFFGLQYNDFNCNPGPILRWLDPTKTLKKQLKGTVTHTLWLRVKFYVPDPLWLQEEFTRYLVYLQVRKDVLNGSLVAPTPILAKMAGLCLQSELGDYSTEDCKPGYVSHIRLVPNQTSGFEAEAAEAHKSFRSYVPASAELKYLYMARRLELYGIHPQEVTDRSRTKLRIGASSQGLSVFRDARRIFLYVWENVEKIAFSGKTFSVSLKHRPQPASLSKLDATLETSQGAANGKQNFTFTYFFDSAKRAKVFWQSAVTCHAFFRVREPVSSGHAFPTLNGGFQGAPISTTTHLSPSASSPSGFSRLFRLRGTTSHRSFSTGTAGVGLERTMSTLLELRRRSKSIEQGFFRLLRGVSRRFSRRRSIAAPGRTQSVGRLNAYEWGDSLGVQSVPSLLDEASPLPKNSSADLHMTSTPDNDINGPQCLPSTETKPVVVGKNDRPFPRKFRSSVPPLSRLKDYELLPSHNWDLEGEIKPSATDNQNTPPQTSPMAKKEKGKADDSPSIDESSPEKNLQKKRDTGSKGATTTPEDVVLQRPTAFFPNRPGDHLSEEVRQNSRAGMSLAPKINEEKSPSVRRSLEGNISTVSSIPCCTCFDLLTFQQLPRRKLSGVPFQKFLPSFLLNG